MRVGKDTAGTNHGGPCITKQPGLPSVLDQNWIVLRPPSTSTTLCSQKQNPTAWFTSFQATSLFVAVTASMSSIQRTLPKVFFLPGTVLRWDTVIVKR